VAAFVLVLASLAAPLRGQTPSERTVVRQWRDSLSRSTDTTALLAIEAAQVDSARADRDNPMRHLRLGFLSLRLTDLTTGASHANDAAGEFQWATELKPEWPYAWYGLGKAELISSDRISDALKGFLLSLGHDAYRTPARHFSRSAEVDSMFTEGLLDVGNEALRQGIPAHLAVALEALRDVGAAPIARNPDILLLRGRVEREAGDVDSAVAEFGALTDEGSTRGLGLLELARTELAAGRISGVQPWYAGLASADSATLRMYRFDLSLVLSDSMLHLFDASKPAARASLMRTFWDSRDPDAVNAGAERLREHYRRLDYSHRHFGMVSGRYDSLRVFDPTDSRFDDRGRIYVRHGEPDDRATLSMIGLPPNESWVYRRPSGDLLFHFAKPDSAQGWRMYESLLDIAGLGAAAQHTGQGNVRARLEGGGVMETYGAAWTAQAARELLYSRENLSPTYGQMLSAGASGAHASQVAERSEGRKSIRVGLQTDSWKMRYELPLTATVDVLAVGSVGSTPELQVVFAIPGTSLYAPPSTGRVVYPVRTRVAVKNAAGELIVAVDTTRNFVAPRQIPEGEDLLGRLPISVPPGDYTVRVSVETPGRGVIAAPHQVHVAALSTPSVTLSDLALGSRSVPLPWATGAADTAWINPLRTFRISEPVELFFEVGGVARGGGYHAEYRVFRSGHKDAVLDLGFEGIATEVPNRVHRELDIGRLGTGNYVLEVTVMAPSGGSAVRRRAFTVTK
jgi:GWxTD domain-containing protein